MKLTTKDTVAKLTLPAGKTEAVVWDDDVPGFGVRLRPHSATYIFRYRHGARKPLVTLGPTSALSPQQARTEAQRLYARAKLGEDPAGTRAEARERANETFEFALKPYLLHKQAQLRPRSFANLDRNLTKHAAPLHRLSLAKAAERRTVAALIAKIASDSGPVAANMLRSSLSGFYDWCIGQGLLDGTGIDTNPTVGIANAPDGGPRTHVPTDADVKAILDALRPGEDYDDIVLLLALTLCRLTEIAGLSWSEVDFAAGLIRLPAARTKTGVARDVPMSKPVRAILERRRRTRAHVFGTGQGGFSGWSRAKRNLDQRAGVFGWRHHDFRRYGSTVLNAEGLALPHVIEAVLGHVVGNRIARTYNLSTYPEQVRVALELWAARVMRLKSGERAPAKVVAMRRRKGA